MLIGRITYTALRNGYCLCLTAKNVPAMSMSEYICIAYLEFNPMAEKRQDPTVSMTIVQEIKETQNSHKLPAMELKVFQLSSSKLCLG